MGLLDDAIREHLDLKRQRGADPGEIERLEREALGPVRREPRARGIDTVPHLEVPHLEEHDDLVHHFEPPTELLYDDEPIQEPKRGFLRRHRPAPAPEPTPSDFLEHLDAGLHGQPGESHSDPFGQDQFDQDTPFPHDDPVVHAQDHFAQDEPATHEHLVPPLASEPPLAPPPAATPALPEAEADPAHRTFAKTPPPRPTFAPISPSAGEPKPPPADTAEPGTEAMEGADATRETREWSVEDAFAAEGSGQSAPTVEPAEEDVLEETPEFLQDTPDHDRLWFEQRPPRDFDFDG